MRNILIAMMITFATEAAAEEQCDVLGSLQAYDKGVFWAASGLSSIYSDEFSDFFNE